MRIVRTLALALFTTRLMVMTGWVGNISNRLAARGVTGCVTLAIGGHDADTV